MKALLLTIAFFLAILAQAQDFDLPVKQQMMNQVGRDGNTGVVQTYDSRYEGMKGSPFLDSAWHRGQLEYADGRVYPDVPLKYDMYRDELWVKNQIQQEVIAFHHTVKRFVIKLPDSDQRLVFTKARYIEGLTTLVEPEQMVQVLYDGEYTVVAERHKLIRKANYKGGYSQRRNFDEYLEIDPQYYLITSEEPVQKIKPKTRSVLRAFAPHEDVLKEFIKEHSLNVANPSDMARLIGYYDQKIVSEY